MFALASSTPLKLASAVAVVMTLTLSSPAAAAAIAVVSDPSGDVAYGVPLYMDIVRASVSQDGGTFTFEMTVAGDIPAAPPLLAPATKQIMWAVSINTDSASFPAGNPVAPGYAAPAEFLLRITWDGIRFDGFVLDRRPLLIGQPATKTVVPFTITGADVRASVESSLLGSATAFSWSPATLLMSAESGANNGYHRADIVPGALWPTTEPAL